MGKDLYTVKDANGKEFTFDFNSISMFNMDGVDSDGRSTVNDSLMRNRVHVVHDLVVVDTKGNAVDAKTAAKTMKHGGHDIVAADVTMEATHSGKNHNFTVYYQDSMEKDYESFLNPFLKPVLKNHNSYSGEPLGRVRQAWHGESKLTDERTAIHLTARITDKSAIERFLDGRYSTVSIGGSMGTVTCNICGKNILKDGKVKFCGHWRGETYKDQVCYWGARDIEYHEVSVVNTPADDFAQIMQVTVITDGDDTETNNLKEDSQMGAENNNNSTQNASDGQKWQKLFDSIDELLAVAKDSGIEKPEQATAPNNSTGQQTDESNAHEAAQTTDGNTGDANKVAELEKKVSDAEARAAAAEADYAKAQKEIETLNDALKEAKEEANSFKDRCIEFARAEKERIADMVVQKEIDAKVLKEDEKDARKEVLMSLSTKDLMAKANAEQQQDSQPQRQQVNVPSPALVEDDSTVENKNSTAAVNDKSKTLDDYVNEITGSIMR